MSAILSASLLLLSLTITNAQNYGDLRLVPAAGSTPQPGFGSGRLEIYVSGRWGTICNSPSLFSFSEANVACKQLGYGQYKDYGTVSTLGYPEANSSVPFWLNGNINCHLSDRRLLNCDHDTVGTGVSFCTHSQDIGLNCSSCDRFLCNDGTCVTACDGHRDCPDGEDENNLTCAIFGGLSTIIKAVIAVVVIVLFLCIVIPVICCIVACFRLGVACFRKPPTTVPPSTYRPMGPVHEYHDEV